MAYMRFKQASFKRATCGVLLDPCPPLTIANMMQVIHWKLRKA